MRRFKGFAALALSASLLVSAAGCGSNGGSGSGSTAGASTNSTSASSGSAAVDYSKAEPITVDFYSAQANYQGIQSGWYGKIIKDKFNMEVNIIAPNVSGGGDTLYQTRSAAGNLGDLVVLDTSKMKDCVDAGLIMDITNLVKDKKNLVKYQLAIDAFKKTLNTDKVYGIRTTASELSPDTPSFFGTNPNLGNYMRYDYYVELGSPKIKNNDDLLNVLKQMHDKHPKTASGKKTYAFSLYKDWDGAYMALTAKNVQLMGYGEASNFVFASADGSKTQVLTDDNSAYYQILNMYFKANQMGLVDPDSSSQNFDTMFAKVKDSQPLYLWYPWMMGNFNTEEKSNKSIGYSFIPVADQSIVNDGTNPYGNEFIFGLGSKAKDPERLAAFLDWYASPEALGFSSAGIKGLNYEMKDGKPVTTEYGKNCWAQNSPVPDEFGGGTYQDGANRFNVDMVNKKDINPQWGESYDTALWSSSLKNNRTKLDDEWTKTFGAQNAGEYVQKNNMLQVVPGNAYSSPAVSSELQNKITQCGTVVKEASWKMIFAKDEAEFNKIWEDMKVQLKGFGYDDVVAADKAKVEEMRIARTEALKAAK